MEFMWIVIITLFVAFHSGPNFDMVLIAEHKIQGAILPPYSTYP